ncbi:hypothetical protein AGLY_014281 [Aphis glycines]|uniref:Uncharacterized protein n=1 Tax=Aphis glycines TaxID=307491 RepID=A0A6G0T5A4_APHGL|nr:hypothetical protein AGLY_014281 [Aphis glycines]
MFLLTWFCMNVHNCMISKINESFINHKKYYVPGSHSNESGNETFVQCLNSFILHRNILLLDNQYFLYRCVVEQLPYFYCAFGSSNLHKVIKYMISKNVHQLSYTGNSTAAIIAALCDVGLAIDADIIPAHTAHPKFTATSSVTCRYSLVACFNNHMYIDGLMQGLFCNIKTFLLINLTKSIYHSTVFNFIELSIQLPLNLQSSLGCINRKNRDIV